MAGGFPRLPCPGAPASGSPPGTNGAVAQLGERCNGIAEVRGSIPLGSTIRFRTCRSGREFQDNHLSAMTAVTDVADVQSRVRCWSPVSECYPLCVNDLALPARRTKATLVRAEARRTRRRCVSRSSACRNLTMCKARDAIVSHPRANLCRSSSDTKKPAVSRGLFRVR